MNFKRLGFERRKMEREMEMNVDLNFRRKIRQKLCQIVNAVILAGVIIFCIGMYYWVVKAGIPYQDPPLELQIQYAVNNEIGNVLVKSGVVIGACGGIVRLLLCVFLKKHKDGI